MKLTKRMQRALARLEDVPGGLVYAEDMLDAWADQAAVADKGFQRFHWGDEAEEMVTIEAAIAQPGDVVIELGELVEVVYQTHKAGKVYDWVHAFARERPRLAHLPRADGNSRAPSLVIVGGSYRVTGRGIVG